MTKQLAHVEHPFEPVFDERSRVLVLGSFPSVRSRTEGFYYGHPQNRFWRVLALLAQCDVPRSIDQKRELLLSHGIALWDVLGRCDICGSSDASIRNAEVNDISALLQQAPIRRVFCNGRKAGELYARYAESVTEMPAVTLPSTSPANAVWTLEKLAQAWREVV